MKINVQIKTCIALAAMLITTTIASAIPFGGESLTARIIYQGSELPLYTTTFVVTGGIELPSYGGSADLRVDVYDVDATHASVLFTSLSSQSFTYGPSPNLVQFTDTFSTIPNILSVTLGAVSWPGVVSGSIAFDSESFSFDFGGLRIQQGDYFRLDITTAGSSVPDASSSALLLGLAATGLALLQRGVCKVRNA